MTDDLWLTEEFQRQRPRLRAVAYRMLGSFAEADDALQDAWLRVDRAGADDVDNLSGWFTTVVARVCLNYLRTRGRRREQPYDVHVPDPVVTPETGLDPEHEVLLADSVGLALQVVIEELSPAERVAFVLHDLFGVPFDQVGGLLDRSPEAARQLASRARRRVQGQPTAPDADRAAQREVVDAFFAASREGDLEGLLAVLDPDVVLRSDGGDARPAMNLLLRGPAEVAGQALSAARLSPFVRPVLVNGAAGVVVAPQGVVQFVMAFTVRDGRVAAIDVLADPRRLAALGLPCGT